VEMGAMPPPFIYSLNLILLLQNPICPGCLQSKEGCRGCESHCSAGSSTIREMPKL